MLHVLSTNKLHHFRQRRIIFLLYLRKWRTDVFAPQKILFYSPVSKIWMISMNFPGQNNNIFAILSSIFCLPSWNCVSLKGIIHHPSGWNCWSSRCSYSLTHIDIQISSCEISNITLTLVYWFLYLLLLLKEEWDVQPEPHISQM